MMNWYCNLLSRLQDWAFDNGYELLGRLITDWATLTTPNDY